MSSFPMTALFPMMAWFPDVVVSNDGVFHDFPRDVVIPGYGIGLRVQFLLRHHIGVCRATLQFGAIEGIHIFDPGAGAFEPFDSRAGRLQRCPKIPDPKSYQVLLRRKKELASDGRLIPPCNAATCLDGSFTTSWRPMGSRTTNKVSAIAALPQNLFIAPRSLEDVPIETVVWVYDNSNTLGTSHMDQELSSTATYANVVSVGLIYEGALILDSITVLEVEKGMLDFEILSEQIDTLSIPPSFPLTLEVENILLDLMDSKPMEVSYHGDGEWSCATLRFGGDDGARIFDPRVFKGVETIQVTYSVVESGVDASHCGDTVSDTTEVVATFQILLYSMVANQSFVNIRVFDFANFGEKFGTAEMLTFMFLIHDPP